MDKKKVGKKDTNTYTPGKHLPVLDGVRGLAIIPVMIYHFSIQIWPVTKSDYFFFHLFSAGWIGVDLFFVLSGFLITGILHDTKKSNNYFSVFFGRRIVRIFPLYYATLILLFFIMPAVSPSLSAKYAVMRENQGWFWLYSANWLFAKEGGFNSISGGYFWSLAVEEQFYLLWPICVYLLDRKKLIGATVVLFFSSLCLRILLLYFGAKPTSVYCMTFTHMEGLIIGALIALLFRGNWLSKNILRKYWFVSIACCFALILLGFVRSNLHFSDFWISTFPYTLLAVAFGCLLITAIRSEKNSFTGWFFNTPLMRSFGKFSYALYIIHVPLGRTLETLLYNKIQYAMAGSPVFSRISFIIIGIGASYIIAFLSWHLFEKHFIALKKYLPYRYSKTL